VLFSERDACWKLTDFGSASVATSKGLVTTSLARGTASYRAPEVLKNKSNSRTDIFGLGCIIFEIITTQRLFSGDWEVLEYAQKGNPIFPDRWPVATQGSRLHDLGQLTSTLLSAEPRERPGAAEALRQLLRLRKRSGSSEAKADPTSEDDFFDVDVENSDVDAPATTAHPTIHSALRSLGETRMTLGGSLVIILLCIHANFSSCLASAMEQSTTSQQPPAPLPPQFAPTFSLWDQDLDSTPADYKREGEDWFAIFNKNVPRKLDVSLVHTFEHFSVVCCVRFSADGTYIATGSNKLTHIFDVKTGGKVATLVDTNADRGCDMYIRSVCFSPDGKYLATGAEDKFIRIWDIHHKEIKRQFIGHEDTIYSLDFSRDGTRLASGSGDRTARLWDMESGVNLLTLRVEDEVTTVAVSPDEKFLAAGSLGGVVRVWDTEKGTLVERFKGHKDSVYSVAFSTSGLELLSGSVDKTIKLWEWTAPRTGSMHLAVPRDTCMTTYVGHKDFVLSVGVSPDGWVVSGSKDRSVAFWDPVDAQPQFMLQGHKNTGIFPLIICFDH